MAAVVQTPLLHGSDAIELSGGTWRKRLLPVGTVDYKGMTLNFTREYLEDLAQAYQAGAYDQVPFQIADAANTHTNDPERTRGWVTGMSADNTGLWVTVQTTPEGSALLSANPRLGVSARIVEEYRRSDGQYYDKAIQHVLGTLDPRIPALGDWEPVDFSNGYGADAEMFIDLSASDWDGEPEWDPFDFAGGGGGHPLAGKLRALSRRIKKTHPDLGTAADHVNDAAEALGMGMHSIAERHLLTAHALLDPQALRSDGPEAKQSRDEINRHLLLVQQDRAAQATDRQATGGQADQNTSGPAFANGNDDGLTTWCAISALACRPGGLSCSGYRSAARSETRPAMAV